MPGERSSLVYVVSAQVGEVGGAAKATLLLCESLVEIGKQVRLFVTTPPTAATRSRLRERRVQVVAPAFRRGARWRLPQQLLALQLFVQSWRERPLLVHSVSLSLEARYLLRLGRAAPVYLWESTEALPHVKFLERSIQKHLHKATVILAPSTTVAENVRRTYGYRGPIKLLPFWVEAPPVEHDPGSHDRRGNLLYVGRLDPDKGFNYLFEAFRQIQPQLPAATLTVCGGGAMEPVRRLAGSNPAIEVRGYVTAEEFEQTVRRCDAVVLPSLHEGYPLSLLEACARRKPIIASSVGSIPEVFGGRACALLVPARDVDALARAMTRLLTEPDESYGERCLDAYRLFGQVSSKPVVLRRLRAVYGSIPEN